MRIFSSLPLSNVHDVVYSIFPRVLLFSPGEATIIVFCAQPYQLTLFELFVQEIETLGVFFCSAALFVKF